MLTTSKLKVLWCVIEGYFFKWLIDLHFLKVPSLNGSCDIVVSLTSYGRRVADGVVYYTLVSLLRQKVQPARIILWLSKDEWCDDTLPKKLLKLKTKGVEIRYCKDTRSYKKLIPTLELVPKSNIMTIDDDIIYTSDTIEIIWKKHLENRLAVICLNSAIPILEHGIPSHYARWKELSSSGSGMLIFPIGYGGTFYPLNSLHRDVVREDLFMTLCPMADDIWFWFCGLLNKTEKEFVRKPSSDLSFDALYQYFHKGSALTHSNRFEHANDKQFRDLFECYSVILDDKGNLIKKN